MPGVTKVILLACGSFNPITNMHLRLFELARDSLHATGHFAVIGGIISTVNDDYGKKGLLPATHRNSMVKLALETSDWIRFDNWESEIQNKWSTTLTVIRHHQGQIEAKRRKLDSNIRMEEEPPQIKLLCGADLLESFNVPNLWLEEDKEEIVSKYGIVCISRSGSDASKFIYENDMLSLYSSKILLITEFITNEISSTHIRRAIRRGQSVKYLIPDKVLLYIKQHGLYGCISPIISK